VPDPPRPTPGVPVLVANNLGRLHPDGKGWLLHGVSLRLEPGDRLAISGPSGSGKTLLLRALALLDPFDEGELLWQGQSVHRQRVAEFRSQVIYLHQRPAFFEEQVETVLQAPFQLRIHRRRPFPRESVLGWLHQAGRNAAFLTQPMRELSGGEMQLVALVRAMALEPAVLLLDEPTAALDEPTGRAIERLVDAWAAERPGRALVWVSHDAGVQQRVTRRSVRIDGGRVVG
jgi:putative ABC transport system ATP-binding protein